MNIFVSVKILKSIFGFYIESSIHVATAICALAGVTFLNYNLEWDLNFFIFLFSASIIAYNFAKYAVSTKGIKKPVQTPTPFIWILTFAGFIGLIFTIFNQSRKFLEISILLGILTLFYVLPLLPHHKSLRALKSLKIFIISLAWVGATLWLPLANEETLFSIEVLWKSLAYFFFVTALMLPFEIRDLQFDAIELQTLPQRYGINHTKTFGYVLLSGFLMLQLFFIPHTTLEFIISAFIALLTGICILFSSKNQPNYYASFWVESIPILWFILLYASKIYF